MTATVTINNYATCNDLDAISEATTALISKCQRMLELFYGHYMAFPEDVLAKMDAAYRKQAQMYIAMRPDVFMARRAYRYATVACQYAVDIVRMG